MMCICLREIENKLIGKIENINKIKRLLSTTFMSQVYMGKSCFLLYKPFFATLLIEYMTQFLSYCSYFIPHPLKISVSHEVLQVLIIWFF